MKNGFDDVYWIRIDNKFGLVRLCIRLIVYLYQM